MTTHARRESTISTVDDAQPPESSGGWGRIRNSRLGNVLVLVVVIAVVLAAAWWMNQPTPDASPVDVAGDAPPPVAGEPAADFTATTTDGEVFSLSEQAGTPVWLSFVATWCSSCRTEAPDIQDAWEASNGEVKVVSVYLGEPTSTVATWAQRLGMTYPQVPDPDGAISGQYRVMAVPSHVFIDREGAVHSTHVGILTRDEMTETLAELATE